MASVIYNLVGPDLSNLGLLHNKVAYVLATRELMQLRYKTYMRGSLEYSWQNPSHLFANLFFDQVKMYKYATRLKSYEHFR